MVDLLLPRDIVIDILSRLPAKSLGRFKSVSKSWFSLVSSPDFIKSHVQRVVSDTNTNHTRVVIRSTHSLHSVDFESPSCYKSIDDNDDDYHDDAKAIFSLKDPAETEIQVNGEKDWGSCYGLVFFVCDNGCIVLWNPTTQKTRLIPSPLTPFVNGVQFYGLGYDSLINDYKMVRCSRTVSSNYIQIEVLNLKGGSWRTVQPGRVGATWTVLHNPDTVGSFSNGAIHWILIHRPENVNLKECETTILSFNVTNEVFSEILLPNIGKNEKSGFFYLGDLKGCLYAVYGGDFGVNMDIWVMKEYGVVNSWTKVISLRCLCDYYMVPVCFTHDDDVVLDFDGWTIKRYNLKGNTVKEFKKCSTDWHYWVVYTETLVSPYG